jgi:hypothetical protein
MSEVRDYILRLCDEICPSGASVTSNGDPKKFNQWTGMTQEGLTATWAQEKIDNARDGTHKCTTSCNSFLGRFLSAVARKGGLTPLKTFGYFSLRQMAPTAYIALDAGDPYAARPKAGDFYEVRPEFTHVGIVVQVNREAPLPPDQDYTPGDYNPDIQSWETMEGGQGGPIVGYDKIARSGIKPFNPAKVNGWIDADLLFAGWKAPP